SLAGITSAVGVAIEEDDAGQHLGARACRNGDERACQEDISGAGVCHADNLRGNLRHEVTGSPRYPSSLYNVSIPDHMTKLLMFIGVGATALWSAQSLQAQARDKGSDARQHRTAAATVQQQGQPSNRHPARVERRKPTPRPAQPARAHRNVSDDADDPPTPSRRRTGGLPTPLSPNGAP